MVQGRGRPLARAEWIFLAKYIWVACEEISENPMMPDPSTLGLVLEAFLAVRALRTDAGCGLDRYYLGNLGVPDGSDGRETRRQARGCSTITPTRHSQAGPSYWQR
jgi:hypothetical protein